MIFTIPMSVKHSQVKITARTSRGPAWGITAFQDDTLPTFTLQLPEGISVNDLEVFVEYLSGDGTVDHIKGATVLKTMTRPKLPPRQVRNGTH
jgi:hypothetical protein